MTINRDLADLVPTLKESGGSIGIGVTSPSNKLDVAGDSSASARMQLARYSADAGGSNFFLFKSRNATIGSQTVVQSGDALGTINWSGSDGTDAEVGASIAAAVDGTPGTNDMPGRLVFSTTADGSGTPTERMRISADGTIKTSSTISVGGATPSTSGAGITFPATQSASTDANTLDDYEEGSFTVTYTASSGSFGAITYTGQDGYYVKIGRVVFFNFTISTSAVTIGTASGELRISGFPFTAGLTNQASNSTFAGRSSGFSGEEPFAMSMLLNTTSGELFYKTSVDGNTINSAPNDLTTSGSGNIIVMNGFYYV